MSRQLNHLVFQDPQFGIPVRLASELANKTWFCRLCPSEGKTEKEIREHLLGHIELIPAALWNDNFRRIIFNANS